jgi:hypothetical protein
MSTELQFNYTSKTYDSQVNVSVEATANYSHAQTCRPKFAQEPSIEGVVLEDDGTLSLSFTQLFAPTGV